MPVNLLGRKLERAQFHVGFGDSARTGCHAEKDKAHMEVTPAGVYVKKADGEWMVPYANVVWTKLAPADTK